MRQSRNQIYVASVLAGAAALWPTLLCALTDALRTPYERALTDAWCGTGPGAIEFLGHCPACWGGAATLTVAALLVAFAPNRQPWTQRRAI
jgi:hypothetical protein